MEDEIYIYKGEEFTRKELEGQYGDRLEEAIDTFGIKKKDLTQSPASLAMQEGFPQAVGTDSEDIDDEEFTRNRAATEVISEIENIYKLGEQYSEFVKKHGVQTEESAKSFPTLQERLFALETVQYGDDKKLYTNSQLRANADKINKLYKTVSDSEEELININQQDKTISFDAERYRNTLTRTQAFSNQIKKIEREEQEFIEGLPDFVIDDLVAASTSAGRAVVNLFDFASILYDAENVSDRQIKNQFKTIGAKKGLGLSQEQIDKGIAGSIEDGDISAAFTNLVVDGAAQVPQLGAALAVGLATRNPELGMSVYAGIAGANAGAAKYAELISDPTMSETAKVLSSVAVGVTEAVASRVFTGGTQSLIRRLGAEGVKRNMPKGILSQARAYGLPLTKGIADEALEEGFAQGFESFIVDHVIRGEEFNPYAVADAMIIGATMGGSVTSATLLPSYRGSYKTAKRRAEIGREIKRINNTIKSGNLSDAEQEAANNKIFNLKKEANNLRKEDAILYKDMSREDTEEVIRLNRRISLNRDRAIESRTEEGKNLILGEIKSDLDKKKAIEQKYDSKTEEQVPSTEQAGEAAVEAQPDTEAGEAAVETGRAVQLDEETQGELDDVMRDADFTVSEQETPTRTSKTDAYADEGVQGGIINLIKTKGGELGREFAGAIERIKSTLGEGYKVVVLDDARYRDVTNTTGRGAYDTKNKVLYLNAQQVRNLDKDNVRAVYHEAIHPILTKRFGEASADFVTFKQDLVNAINRSLSEQDAATLIARLEAFEKQYKKDKTTEQQAEEFMTELGAIMTSEDVELLKKSGLLNRVKELINNLLRKLGVDISLDTENEVVEFMNSLAQGVRGGVAVADIVKKEDTGYVVPSEEALQESRGTVAINPDDVRSLNRAGSKVGMGLKTKTVKKVLFVIGESEEMSIAYAREVNPKFYLKTANQLAQYPLVSGVKKLRKVGMDGKKPMYINYNDESKRKNELKKADEIYSVFKEQVKGNLRFLMDNASNDFKELMTLWYDGANKIASDFSSRFGYTSEQAAGVIASLSPQKDWYQNVRLAELVMEAMTENPTLTDAMVDKMVSIRDQGYKAAKRKGEKEAEEHLANTERIISYLRGAVGTSLNNIPNEWKPYLIRLDAEINKSKNYDILLPDGNSVSLATTKSGKPAKWGFGSFTEIGKAVSILLDGSQNNISAQLGKAHKIRNFYNNIIDPMSEDGDVTMDTHAVAASLLLPVSGSSKEVTENLSGIKSDSDGLAGNYFAHADAYRELAEEMGYLPRQIQSITWEVVRGLYTKGFKGNKQNVNDVREIFDNFAKGKITIDEARNQAAEKAGGFSDPTWGEFVSEESRNRSRQESERRRSDELRRDAVRRGERGGLEETPLSESRRGTTKLIRDISVLITPATVREATPLTKKIKALSEKYDKLVKQFSETREKETLDEIRKTEAQILNGAKQEITEEVSKIKGVSVSFDIDNRGLWDGSFEPSLNMMLSITSQADTEAASKLLFDFAEKYSQDAFILEADSNFEQDVMNGERMMPLTEFDEFGLMHYPQIVYTFSESLTDEQVGDLSVSLQDNGVDAFTINNDEVKISVIKFFPEDSQLNEAEQYEERKKDLEAKSRAAKDSAFDVLGRNISYTPNVRIRKSSYQGARNEGTEEQTREYDRSDVFKPFKEAVKKEAPLQESRNLAPNGQPSNLNDEQYKIVRTPEFKRWFGDWENDPANASKVVDENGEPLVVYHGTKEAFDKFEPSKISQGVITGQQGIGFYFTQNKKEAESYGSVKEIFLSIKNPFEIKRGGKSVSVEQAENILSKGDYSWFFKEGLPFFTRSKGMNLSKKELIKKYAEQLHQFGDKDILQNLKRAYTPESYSKLMSVQAEELGADGAVEEVTRRATVYVTYAPSQSKLADGSNKTFDPEKEGLKESRNFDRKIEKAMEGVFYQPKIDERFNKASKRQMANKKLFDRQGIIRRALQDANDLITQAALSVRNGSSAAAKKMYERFNKNIFLNVAGEKLAGINEIIMLRRIISIYDGFDRGIDTFQQEIKDLEAKKKRTKKETARLEAVKKQLADLEAKKANFKNPRKLNRESALARLDEIKQKLRDETGNDQQFFDMDNRASRFFAAMREILKRKLDEGLITQDEYLRLSKYEYSPRMFVDKVFDLQNGDFAKHEKRFMGYGLSEKEFKKLKEGSEEDLFMEGDFLLRMVVAASERRVFANRLFKQLGKKVGSYEWLSDTKKNGFSELTYKEDGESRSIYVRNDIAEEIENADSAIEAGLGKVGKYFGTNILRAMATGYNPLFPLSNIPMDFANVVMFTDTYDDKSLARAMIELSKDFRKNLAGIGTITAAFRGTTKADPKVLKNLEEAFEAGIGMDFLTNQGRVKFKSVDGSKLQRIGQTFGDFMSSFGENSELAMRLSVYNKVKADSLKKRKDGDAQFKDMSDAEIRAYAAFKARATIDFSQGGSLAKSLDKMSPYFNASLQGLRVAGNYIRTNPAKFGKKLGESALYAITMSFVMQHLFEMFGWDDDDKEAIPEYHRRNYFIIPLGDIDDDGNKEYIKIRKLPQLAPLLGLFDLVGEATYRSLSGESEKNNKEFYMKGLVDFENTLKAATVFGDMVLEFDEEGKPSIDLRGTIQYSPPVAKAMGQYITNYDFFRERNISYEKLYNQASPEFEGKFDDNVEEFYKEFGELTGMSPKRTKNAVEVVTTSPSTNLMVGVGYGIANAIMAGDKSFKDVTKGMEKRAIGTANKKYIPKKPSAELNKLLQEYKDNQFVVRKELTKMVVEDNAPKKDVIQYVNGIEDRKLREYAIKKYKKLQRKNKFDDLILDRKSVYYNLDDYMSEKPELAAEYLFNEFGSLTNQELREVASYISMIRGTRSFSYPPAFMRKYRELQK